MVLGQGLPDGCALRCVVALFSVIKGTNPPRKLTWLSRYHMAFKVPQVLKV